MGHFSKVLLAIDNAHIVTTEGPELWTRLRSDMEMQLSQELLVWTARDLLYFSKQ